MAHRCSFSPPSRRKPEGRARTTAALAIAAFLGLIAGVATLRVAPDEPESGNRALTPRARNVLLICIDTLRADHLGLYGYPRRTSPRLDRLAADGAVFLRAQAQSNWTVPATASILTSRIPSRHGAGLRGIIRSLGDEELPAPIAADARSLATVLREAGFRTGLFSANPFLYGRFKEGFEEAAVDWVPAATLNDRALTWLSRSTDRRFFLYLQYMDLHQPVEPPEPFFDAFQPFSAATAPRDLRHWSFGRQLDLRDEAFLRYRDTRIGLYDGALLYVDAEIGRLVDRLADLRLLADTMIVVTSDHGEEFWDHAGFERELGGDPRGLWGIGHGHSMYQELLHVPLVVTGPGVAAGVRIECDARQIDVAPTIIALLGLRAETAMEGVGLASLLGDVERKQACRSLPMLAESPAYGHDSKALVWESYKLIVRADGVAQLFDLAADPGERVDLSTRFPGVVSRLRRLLSAETRRGAEGPASPVSPSDEIARQLRALDYLGSPRP